VSLVPTPVSTTKQEHEVNFKRRGNRISLYGSSWVPKGPEVSQGNTRQALVGSIQADATEISLELAAQLTQDECTALASRILAPAAAAQEAKIRRAKQREADPAWRL
jgi:hypothetical protein